MSLRTALTAVAALLFASSANAHMIMANPIPFSVDKIDNAPITAEQYPCKINLGFTVSTMNNMKVGDEQTLSFKGSAIHGGGSCQLSITTDKTPTANSKFKVIQSMEGGCPGINGPQTFKFKIPDSIPNGQVSLAWSWFSRLSGGPELYMNCAPVMVTGGASDTTAFDQLPDMLIANIATAQCTTPPNFNTKFPNPGQVLLTDDSAAAAELPTGAGCQKAVGGGAAPSGGASASSAAATSAATEAPTNTGGVFAPGASSAASSEASYAVSSAAASAPAAESTSTLTTLVTLTASPSTPADATSTPEDATSAPAAAGTSVPAAGTSVPAAAPTTPSGGGDSTCTTNGAVMCNGPSQFGLCDNGKVVWQAVAAGTTCSNGQITKRQWRRELRGRVPLKPEDL